MTEEELEAELAAERAYTEYLDYLIRCDADAPDLTEEQEDSLVRSTEAMVEQWIYG